MRGGFAMAWERRVRPSDIVMMDGVTLASTIRARQASCAEVMTAYLDHIESTPSWLFRTAPDCWRRPANEMPSFRVVNLWVRCMAFLTQ